MSTNSPEQPFTGAPEGEPEQLGEQQPIIPHSGVHHDEKPFLESDMSLQEYVDQKGDEAPEHPGYLFSPGVDTPETTPSRRNRAIALVGLGAVLAAGAFVATHLQGKDKPRAATNSSSPAPTQEQPSTATTNPATSEQPTLGPRIYLEQLPQMQLADFTPTFVSETSRDTLIKNYLANVHNYVTMALPGYADQTAQVQSVIYTPDSSVLQESSAEQKDLSLWLINHYDDAKYYTWELLNTTAGTIDRRDDQNWIVSAEVVVTNKTQIQHRWCTYMFKKAVVPFYSQPIWVLDRELLNDQNIQPR